MRGKSQIREKLRPHDHAAAEIPPALEDFATTTFNPMLRQVLLLVATIPGLIVALFLAVYFLWFCFPVLAVWGGVVTGAIYRATDGADWWGWPRVLPLSIALQFLPVMLTATLMGGAEGAGWAALGILFLGLPLLPITIPVFAGCALLGDGLASLFCEDSSENWS